MAKKISVRVQRIKGTFGRIASPRQSFRSLIGDICIAGVEL